MTASIIRGTTPTITVTSEELDFTDYTCYLSCGRRAEGLRLSAAYFTAPDSQMTKTATVISCKLTQEQTLAMNPGGCVMQLRAVDSDGVAVASYAVGITVADVTQKGVVYYA